jgi:hypothetical protein
MTRSSILTFFDERLAQEGEGGHDLLVNLGIGGPRQKVAGIGHRQEEVAIAVQTKPADSVCRRNLAFRICRQMS